MLALILFLWKISTVRKYAYLSQYFWQNKDILNVFYLIAFIINAQNYVNSYVEMWRQFGIYHVNLSGLEINPVVNIL